MLLGVSKHGKWKKEIIMISPGDGLLLYTDGVTEGLNEQGIYYLTNMIEPDRRRYVNVTR